MQRLKPGDIVICINDYIFNSSSLEYEKEPITIGRKYIIEAIMGSDNDCEYKESYPDLLLINNDISEREYYEHGYFVSVVEYRELKLNKLLNEG